MVDVFLFCYMHMMLLLCLIQKINCKKRIIVLLIMYVNINISELFFTNIWILLNVQIISQMLQAEHLELLYVP